MATRADDDEPIVVLFGAIAGLVAVLDGPAGNA